MAQHAGGRAHQPQPCGAALQASHTKGTVSTARARVRGCSSPETPRTSVSLSHPVQPCRLHSRLYGVQAPKSTVAVKQGRPGSFSNLLWGNTEVLLMTVAASQGTVFTLMSLATSTTCSLLVHVSVRLPTLS